MSIFRRLCEGGALGPSWGAQGRRGCSGGGPLGLSECSTSAHSCWAVRVGHWTLSSELYPSASPAGSKVLVGEVLVKL